MHNGSKIIKRKKQALKIVSVVNFVWLQMLSTAYIYTSPSTGSQFEFSKPSFKVQLPFLWSWPGCVRHCSSYTKCGHPVGSILDLQPPKTAAVRSPGGKVSASQQQQLLNINSKQQLKKAKVTGLWGPFFFSRGTVIMTCINKRTL